MKIIGKTEDGWIVDIHKYDLEKLTGYYYRKRTFSVGTEIKIDELFSQLTKLNTHKYEIKKMVHSLKTAAGMLEKIDPVFFKQDEEKET